MVGVRFSLYFLFIVLLATDLGEGRGQRGFSGIHWYVEVKKNRKQVIDNVSSRLSGSMELTHMVRNLLLQTFGGRVFQGRTMA